MIHSDEPGTLNVAKKKTVLFCMNIIVRLRGQSQHQWKAK
jgi:hypothetical protein